MTILFKICFVISIIVIYYYQEKPFQIKIRLQGGVGVMRRFIPLGFILVVFFTLFQCEAFAGNIKWNKNIDIGIGCFHGIAQSSAGILAVVGEDGVIKTSTDGITWTGIKSGTTRNIKSVIWANDRFVAVGEGVILTSYDGVEWSGVSSVSLNSVVFANNRFVAVGMGTVRISDDGVSWKSADINTNEMLNDVYYSGDLIIALGEKGGIYTSDNGEDWEKSSISTDVALKSVCRGQNRYIAAAENGSLLTSLDGLNWSWILNGTANVGASSVNGGNDKLQGIMNLGKGLEDIIYDGDKFIAVGLEGSVFVSKDGVKWIKGNSNASMNLYGVIWTGASYIAVGENGGILTSPDAVKWKLGKSGLYSSITSFSEKTGSFKSVVWGNNRFVVVGDSGLILSSPDGELWTRSNYKGDEDFYKVIYTGRRFAAAGSRGVVLFSNDGINWTRSNTGVFSRLKSIAWNGRIYVAVGDTGEILTSSDGTRWTISNTGKYKSIDRIIWDKNRFVAVEGRDEALLISTNAVDWSRNYYIKDGFISNDVKDIIIIPRAENLKDKVEGFDYINQVIWNGTEYIGVGNLTDSSFEVSEEEQLSLRMGNSIMTSVDGLKWKKGEIGTCRNINSIAWNGEKLVAVGEYRTIVSSIPAYIKVLINGKPLASDPPPIIRNDRTMVPFRAVFEALGLTVGWDDSTKTITGSTVDGITISLKLGSKVADVNGTVQELDTAPLIVNGRTLVPVRFIAESLGAVVDWDKVTKTIIIKDKARDGLM